MQEMWSMFKRLLQRVEQTEAFLTYCVQNNMYLQQVRINNTKAETLMLNEAIKCETDAGIEELLGNLERYVINYDTDTVMSNVIF